MTDDKPTTGAGGAAKYDAATQGRTLLAERAERLHKLIKLRAPAVVICAEVELVVAAAFLNMPEQMGVVHAARMRDRALGAIGACSLCLGYMPHEMQACEKCIREGGADYEVIS